MAKQGTPRLDKFAIAAALQEIAALMELKGGPNRFKAKAYNAGARAIQGVSNLDQLVAEDRLTSVPRIGSALASQIKQLYLTGESSVLNGLREEFPAGIVELSTVPGLSLSKIKTLHDELGISSIAQLEAAADAGELRNVKGFGAKTEERLLGLIRNKSEKPSPRLHLHHAINVANNTIEFLKSNKSVIAVSIAGSLRRWVETVGTIDLVVNTKNSSAVLKHLLRYPLIASSEPLDQDSVALQLVDGARVVVTFASPDTYALALLVKTGSDQHLQRLQEIAAAKKVTLGLINGRTKRVVDDEVKIYAQLKMQFVPPELRENEGEVEAALAGKLPEDLLTLGDIRGMVHCHTTYSDGRNSLEEMVLAAEAMGMEYITITDHSPTAFYANGLNVDRLERQWEEIDEVQERVKIKILRGTESDIVASGALDYPNRILEKFDVIVASIHSRYKMDKAKMTERIVTAMRQPVFKVWGHALGRLLERRPPFECDVERILDVIAESKAAVEINGDPYRLDLEPRWVREARKRKIKFVISVDAHSTGALFNLQYGVRMARRGWVRRSEVLNTLPPKSFAKSVRPL
ncbi:MAG TPA: PHP domain-containing protein [Pyrinomonadaceae bacterium]|nr:PHP domain-containing protein [Pyrinomonadaceae bacterium]